MAGEGTRSGTVLGPYAIGELLGRGGMGEVYLAHDERRDRDVALKVLHASAAEDPQFRERFTRESQTVARLADPHVIPIHDFGEIDGVLYIDMRLVEGRNLAEVLRDGPLPPERAVTLVEQVAGALDAAHAKGLVHRDVKPANIELTESGFPYLLDFGLAVADTQTRMTSAGIFVGSQAYAAPERFDGDSATVASDVYSLACVLFEALTGRAPFKGESLGVMLKQHLTGAIPKPSESVSVPAAMDDVIARGMAKNPADRFSSCGLLAGAARAALAGHSVETVVTAPDYGDTVIRPTPAAPAYVQQPPSYPPNSYPQAQPSYAQSQPSYPQVQPYGAPPRRSRAVPILAAVAAVLVGATAVLGYVALSDRGTTNAASTTTTAAAAGAATITETVTPTATAETTTAAADPAAALRSRANADRATALAALNDRWAVQLSSKYAGLVAEGRTWTEADILADIASYEQRYGSIRVLNSHEWTVFAQDRQYWVVIYAPITYDEPDTPVAWCRSQRMDRDHCFAKLISNTHGIPGSTVFPD